MYYVRDFTELRKSEKNSFVFPVFSDKIEVLETENYFKI
jgi:hypothetical protein